MLEHLQPVPPSIQEGEVLLRVLVNPILELAISTPLKDACQTNAQNAAVTTYHDFELDVAKW